MATKHHDSKRTSRSHEQSIQRRISTHEKNLDRYLAERAFKRLMAEFNVNAARVLQVIGRPEGTLVTAFARTEWREVGS